MGWGAPCSAQHVKPGSILLGALHKKRQELKKKAGVIFQGPLTEHPFLFVTPNISLREISLENLSPQQLQMAFLLAYIKHQARRPLKGFNKGLLGEPISIPA